MLSFQTFCSILEGYWKSWKKKSWCCSYGIKSEGGEGWKNKKNEEKKILSSGPGQNGSLEKRKQ